MNDHTRHHKDFREHSPDYFDIALFEQFPHLCHNLRINIILKRETFTIDSSFTRRDFLHCFASFCKRELIKTWIIRDVPSSLFPKSAKICLELPVAAQMIHRIIALIADRINMRNTNNACNGLRHVENKIFRAIAMSAFRNILDKIACMIHIWPLHGSNIESIFTATILVEPEHHLIKLNILQSHDNREQTLFSLPRR